MKKRLFSIVLIVVTSSLYSATFTVAPTLTETDGKAVITFTVSGPSDVEVGIVDKNGKVVRHLAAGVLGGGKAPPEPLDSNFTQSLEWDGLDDYGHVLFTGPFTARVRLGVSLAFEKRISTRVYPTSWPVRYWSDTSHVYPGNLGTDSNVSTDTLLPMTHPVWRTGNGHYGFTDTFPGGTTKIRFYESFTKLDLTASDEDDRILIHGYRTGSIVSALLDGISGNVIKIWTIASSTMFPSPAGAECPSAMFYYGEPMFDWYGRYVLHDEGGGCNHLFRFTPEGANLPFASGSHVLAQTKHSGSDLRQRGIATGPDGMIYHGHSAMASDSLFTKSGGGSWYYVSKYDSNGALVNDSLLKIWGNIGQGIRVDMKGNIFAGIRVRPYPDSVPPAIKPLLQGGATDKYAQNYWARVLYGSIVKFGPGGGMIVPDAAGPLMAGHSMNRARAERMVWMHYGASFQPSHVSYVGATCICYAPRFDVDRYGRVIFPNGFENEFKALDNNGNLIFRAHNRDFVGRVKIGLIHAIQATDRAVYCADYINNQIVCFTWNADAEASLPVPTLGVDRIARSPGIFSIVNQPNPFTPSTLIHVAGLQPSERINATLAIYDVNGRRVADLSRDLRSGKTSLRWNARDFAGNRVTNGVFYCRLNSGHRTFIKAMVVAR